ncbi:MAG: DNA polymerase III subunit beta [Spirochaetes bacterium]|nr:DNA polymerase III subunit beta [Spirochaetota bacterium]
MKIEVDRDLLLKSISTVDSLIPSRSVNAVLSNCLFNVSKDEIEIVSTDNEIGIKTSLDAYAESDISFTVNGTRFSSLLKEMPAGVIIIDINDSFQIDIRTKSGEIKGDFTLIGTSGDDYPEIPDFYEDGAVEIKQSELKNMIRKVVYAAATDTIKPFFNGVYFVSQSRENLTLVATDSRRLSIITRNIKNELDLDEGIILPLKAVQELQRLLSQEGTCRFSIQESQCFFRIGRSQFVTRTVDHKFPNYRQVIPKDQDISVTVQKSRLLESIRRALIFTRPPAYTIVCKFTKETLNIEVKTSDLGECMEDIAVDSNVTDNVVIGLNAQFLYDTIREMESDSINIGITGEMSPVKFVPDNDPDYISVIMPIKIKSHESD